MKPSFLLPFLTLIDLHPIQGQINSTDSLMLIEASEITVIAQKDRLLSGVPGSASYVKPIELRRVLAISGNEIFRKLPGVNVVDEEGIGLRANIGIRGLDPDRSANVLVLEDGIPVQLNPYGEPELYYTPSMDRMSALEVVKGSGQILFGPRTIGGVVNYITADPPAAPEAKIELRGGSGGYFGALLGYGTTMGNTGLAVQYQYKRADQIGVTGFDVHDLNAKFRMILSPKSVLGLKFQVYNESSNSTYLGLTQPMFDQGEYYPVMAPDDQLKVSRYALSATHKYFISKNLRLTTAGYLYTISRDWRRQSFSSNPNAANQTGVVWGDINTPNGAIFMQNETLYRNRSFQVGGAETKLTWDYKIGQQKSQLDVGVRVISEQAHEQELLGKRPDARSGALVRDEVRPGYAVSGFVQNKFALSKQLSITAGLRMEDYHFERSIYLYKTASGTYRDTNITAPSHVSALIPGLGFNYTFNKNATVFGGLHKGFAPPAIKNSLSTAGEVFPLDAQESWNYELGIRSVLSKSIEGELTGFYLDFDKQVIPVSESSGGSGNGYTNAGRTKHVGAEASLRIDFGSLFESKYSIYWQGNVTYAQATYNSDRFVGTEKENLWGKRLPYAPEWLNTQTIGFVAPWNLEIQLSSTQVSKQFTNDLNTITPGADGRSGVIPAYFVADGSVRYSIPKWKMSVFGTVKNLTDARYIASRRPQGIKVGIPQMFVLGVEKKF
ncbi:MAG: TonB-dependent receptor plug domain-containing protein [Saprospiraceae bacterium]|nr:TonB-dependent receptor plug domain-containing protein [Saprospiraceae bacterium]